MKRQFEGFFFFYRYIGNRIILAMALSILVGVLDGFGLSMFLPLLQVVDTGGVVNTAELGGLGFLVRGIQGFGVSITLLNVLAFIVVFFSLKSVIVFIQFYYRVFLQEYFIRKIRFQTINGLNGMAYKSFVQADSGRIQNTLSGEVDRVSRAYQGYFQGVQCIIMVIVYIGFAFTVNAGFALLVSAGGLLTNLVYRGIYIKTKGTSRVLADRTNFFQGLIIQYVYHFKYLKATGGLETYSTKLQDAVTKIESNNKHIGMLMAILNASREPLVIVVVAVVIYIQTGFLGSPLGPILISLLFFYRALSFLMQAQSHLNYYLSVSGSMANIDTFIDELRKARESKGKEPVKDFHASLSILNGSLQYHDKIILDDINLSVQKNETVAFVGESGSGKTSLINVLSGLLPLDAGTYRIDGRDRNEIDMVSFQQRIGYITQDPVIFADTVYNNVTLWASPTESNMERFHLALKKAAAFQFVSEMPLGKETLLGSNGINLSGGQKQRISIARELFKQIDILILDEATSALDSETERSIQENFDALKGDYTMLIVAHRLSTVKSVDKIVLITNGKIEAIGSFQKLMETSPKFNRMVQLQELK